MRSAHAGVAPYTNQTVWPYIAAHNVILAHLAAVIKFRELQVRGDQLRRRWPACHAMLCAAIAHDQRAS